MKHSISKYYSKGAGKLFFLLSVFLIYVFPGVFVYGQGATWEHVYHNPKENLEISGVASNNTRFVAIGYGWINYTSSDGLKWKSETPVPTTYFGIAFGNGRFVAVGYKGSLITSADGITWASKNTGVTGNFGDVVYAADLNWFLAIAAGGQIAISKDGGNTFSKYVDPDLAANDVTYGNGRFVAAGGLGQIFYSDDGENWTKKKIGANHFMCAGFGNNTFVVAGKNDIYTSADGINWVKRVTDNLAYFQEVTYTDFASNNMFVVVGESLGGPVPIRTSPDGVTWTKRTSNARSHLVAVNSKGNSQRIVAMGVWSTIVQSDNIVPSITVTNPDFGVQPVFQPGSSQNITWTTSGTVGNIMLEYSTTGGGGTYTVIEDSIPASTGTYSWTVPTANSTNCIIRVSETDGEPLTHSAPFTISDTVQNTITVISPDGGETLTGGTTHDIRWTSSITFDEVDIEYYDGSDWNVVVNDTKDDGTYTWTVPNISTSKAKIWLKGWHSSGNAADYSESAFTIVPAGNVGTITLTAPNGGESLMGGTNYEIRWTSSKTFDSIDIEYYDGSKWKVIINGTEDDGSHSWTVPNISTTKAEIWIKGWDDITDPIDKSDGTFEIFPAPSGSITVTSPNGGEVWAKNSTENITWTSDGEVGNVRITYTTDGGFNWNTIVSSTKNEGTYAWTLPNVIADDCLVKVNDVSNSLISDVSNNLFSIGGPPQILMDRDRLNFGYVKNGASACTQTIFISNGGGGTLDWTAAADVSWLNLSPAAGNNNGAIVTVSVDASALAAGSYTGTITISDPDVENSPQTVEVFLTVKNSNQDQSPFGAFATPEDGLTGVTGSIGVTGWVLDDICLESVKIYREVNGELSYIGDAVFVEGARPDVEQSYPDYPNNSRAGWGYMLLTNFLPDGQLILKTIATDTGGHQVTLGTKTITVDNANAEDPFGAIDSPAQGGDASGTKYRNNGWALTPMPNKIPEDGSTINVYIDGAAVGKANYNLYRADIAQLFPGYANTDGSWGYLDIDTTAYSNGVHTISWGVTDNVGNTEGIGSRYFTIQNSGGAQRTTSRTTQGIQTIIPLDNHSPIAIKRGYSQHGEPQEVLPGKEGVAFLEAKELDRIQIQLPGRIYAGYLKVGQDLKALPIGSSINSQRDTFYWQLSPAFLGNYDLEFIVKDWTGVLVKKRVRVAVTPKFTSR